MCAKKSLTVTITSLISLMLFAQGVFAERLPFLRNCGHVQGVTTDDKGRLYWTFKKVVIVTAPPPRGVYTGTDRELKIIGWRAFSLKAKKPSVKDRCRVAETTGVNRQYQDGLPLTQMRDGKLDSSDSKFHIGDPTFFDGKLYLPIQFGFFGEKDRSWVYAYEPRLEARLRKERLIFANSFHLTASEGNSSGIGGMTVVPTKTGPRFIVFGQTDPNPKKYGKRGTQVYIYDEAFKLKREVLLPIGPTCYGIQTATYDATRQKVWFGVYQYQPKGLYTEYKSRTYYLGAEQLISGQRPVPFERVSPDPRKWSKYAVNKDYAEGIHAVGGKPGSFLKVARLQKSNMEGAHVRTENPFDAHQPEPKHAITYSCKDL